MIDKNKDTEKEIPDTVRKLLELEEDHNTSLGFFQSWLHLLEDKRYEACPERDGHSAKFTNSNIRSTATTLWGKAKKYFKDKTIHNWVIEKIKSIIENLKISREVMLRGTYPKILKDYEFERDNKELVTKVKWVENCVKCDKEGRIIGGDHCRSSLYRCPICRQFYCVSCMSRIQIHTSDLSCYNSCDFDLEDICKPCLGEGLIQSVKKLMDISVEFSHRNKSKFIKIE